MKNQIVPIHGEQDLPKGINRSRALPDPVLGAQWDSIVMDDRLKKQLLSQAVLNFSLRAKVDRSVIPLHGVIMLVGPPGTGKTSLARGLAHRVAETFPRSGFRLLEVEPHTLTSSAMGKTQRAVSDLFSQAIAEAAAGGPTIVLLDEVETLAADRSKMSLEANPIDILATSNFPQAVDAAFMSRCDLVMDVPMPDRKACAQILKDCLTGLAKTYPPISRLTTNPIFDRCAEECVGLDGRAIRKMVANALACDPETALNPGRVTIDDLYAAARAAKEARAQRGKI